MWKIKKGLLETLLESSQRYYPDEFMCFLGGKRKEKLLDEIVMLPTINGKNFASFQQNLVPIDDSIIGTFHSHPTGPANPSSADKKLFQKYEVNFILSLSGQVFRAFDRNGKELLVELIE